MSTPLAAGLVLLLAAGVAIWYERRRRDRHDDIEAIADATRERLPRRWTAADWADLERELSK